MRACACADSRRARGQLRGLEATVLVEPSDTEFGRRAVVKDFEGHKVELYEKMG